MDLQACRAANRAFISLSWMLVLVFILVRPRHVFVDAFSPRLGPASPRTTTPGLRRLYSSVSSLQRDAIVPGSTLELIEPETGCEVVLLGCFHGSKSSSMDVCACLDVERETQVVVLELCASRFADLRRDMQRQSDQTRGDANRNFAPPRPWVVRFGAMIAKTIESRGFATGVAAALLGGIAGMQTALSGLDPGLEFRTALQRVEAYDKGECDIVLADQNVDETLEKVGRLFSVSSELWKQLFEKGWEESFGREARALLNAVGAGGNFSFASSNTNVLTPRLNLFDFCTRSSASVQDMVRLMLPSITLMQLFILGLNELAGWVETKSGVLDASIPSSVDVTNQSIDPMLGDFGAIVVLLVNLMILGFGYLSVALPAARIILRERDDRMTEGIREACRVAARRAPDGEKGRVLAVLGLLHVNGIALQLSKPSVDCQMQ